ncbi:LytR/AlgR family response regulator transcription factor [Dysgonomonas alginatilytica]|nr:LytTR family DNA-binding domain-containing protein [Dysgonomonas alginatilytica]
MTPLISLPASYLFLDGIVCGLLLATLSFLLKEVFRYANHKSLPMTQQIINYGALAVLFVLCWVGISLLVLNILLPEGTINFFFPTIPIRILIALLVYGLLISLYRSVFIKEQEQGEDVNIEVESEEILNLESHEETVTAEKAPEDELLEHVAVKNGQKIDLIFINEIISIQAEGDYVMIFTSKGKYLKEQTMKYFADHLPKNKFVRVHRSNIINIDYIQRIELYEKQNQVLKLHNNLQVKMSLAGYKELKKVLNL